MQLFSKVDKEAGRKTTVLVRGDSGGRIVVWKLPDVSERQMTLVRQESFDRLPGRQRDEAA